MRSALRVSALLIALGGGLGLMVAQHRGILVDETVELDTAYAPIIDDFDLETTGSILNLASAPRLSLSDEQRGLIFLGVINLRDVPDTAIRAPEPGVPLPQGVELHDIPAMVVSQIPEVAGYKFVKLEDRILVVSADSRQIEAAIPRYKLVFN
jgi:hypothetical protein